MCRPAILATSEALAEKQNKQTCKCCLSLKECSQYRQPNVLYCLPPCSVRSFIRRRHCKLSALSAFVYPRRHLQSPAKKKLGRPYFSTDSRTGAPARHLPPPHVSFHRGEKYEKQYDLIIPFSFCKQLDYVFVFFQFDKGNLTPLSPATRVHTLWRGRTLLLLMRIDSSSRTNNKNRLLPSVEPHPEAPA